MVWGGGAWCREEEHGAVADPGIGRGGGTGEGVARGGAK